MLLAFAVLIGVACVGASGRRLWLLASLPSLEPEVLLAALGPVTGARERSLGRPSNLGETRVRAAIEATPAAAWERALLAALAEPPERRAPLVNEQLSELDFQAQQWQRVPRVCASIATSAGFLGATLALRTALADMDAMGDGAELDVNAAIARALGVAACGIAATSFCVAIHYRARLLGRRRLAAADRLVERLEALAPLSEAPGAAPSLAPPPISGNIAPASKSDA